MKSQCYEPYADTAPAGNVSPTDTITVPALSVKLPLVPESYHRWFKKNEKTGRKVIQLAKIISDWFHNDQSNE